jgi:hypothetical protein
LLLGRRRQPKGSTARERGSGGAQDGSTIAMDDLIRIFTERGDLAHLALFLWASVASAAALFALRELAGASRRFDEFVRQLARFNRRAHRRHRMRDDTDDI